MPWARFALSLLRIPVCVLIDLACVPVNAVVLTRNLLPGRWSLQRSRSWPCLQGVALWIWRGEGTAVALVVIRPLVCTLLASHFRRRLHLVRRRLYLDEGLPTDVQAPLLDQLDQALRHWKAPSVGHIIVTYGLPAAGLLIAVFPSIAGGHFVRSERAIGSVRFAVSGSAACCTSSCSRCPPSSPSEVSCWVARAAGAAIRRPSRAPAPMVRSVAYWRWSVSPPVSSLWRCCLEGCGASSVPPMRQPRLTRQGIHLWSRTLCMAPLGRWRCGDVRGSGARSGAALPRAAQMW